jgi:hypothetical protein
MLAGIGVGAYLLFVKFSTNPLLPRNPTELVLILSPGKTKFFKITTRQLPFFFARRAMYWYADPLKVKVREQEKLARKMKKIKDVKAKAPKQEKDKWKGFGLFAKKQKIGNVVLPPEPEPPTFKKGAKPEDIRAATEVYENQLEEWRVNKEAALIEHAKKQKEERDAEETAQKFVEEKVKELEKLKEIPTGSLLHIYVDAVNQPVYSLKRNTSKTMDLVIHRGVKTEVAGHKLIIPPKFAFGNNWKLLIYPETNEAVWQKTREKQPYKLNFFVRMGVYIVRTVRVETGVASTNTNAESQQVLEAVTVQKIVDQVGGTIKDSNYSSTFAYSLMKNIKHFERMWVATLLGAMDMRIVIILLVMVAGIAMYFMIPAPSLESLGPPPPGVKIP